MKTKTWYENTTGAVQTVGGKLLQPGEGTIVEDGSKDLINPAGVPTYNHDGTVNQGPVLGKKPIYLLDDGKIVDKYGNLVIADGNSGSIAPIIVSGGVDLDIASLSATYVTDTPGSGGVDGVSYGEGTTLDCHWFQWVNLYLGGRLTPVKNYAVSGFELSVVQQRWAVPATNPL